jgi:hypothetical protein
VQVAEALELACAQERPNVDRAHPGVADEPADGGLGFLVVPGDEDVERLAGDAPRPERPGERRGSDACASPRPPPEQPRSSACGLRRYIVVVPDDRRQPERA